MPDRLEEALAEVLARIENGETVTADDLRARYPALWEQILDALDIGGRIAGIGGAPAAACLQAPAETKLRTVEKGRYERFRLLGEGGMGLVYWALDTELNREVAFKIVRPAAHESASGAPDRPTTVEAPAAGTPASRVFETLKARFLQEAWVTAGLEHPGIVPVYEVGRTSRGVPYYTMRFVRGSRTLTQAMDEAKGRPVDERLALLDPFLRVCDTMRYAHAHGVVHRDLKPDNVALGEFGEVVVLDWGIAKIRDRPDAAGGTWRHRLDEFRESADLRTKAGALGTPGYMSPEAATGRIGEVDERSDVYSLGAVLYQLLTGRLPYDFRTYGELLHAMNDAAPVAPAVLDATVPRTLAAICLRALARERGERQQSVDALATEVRAWLAKRARDHEIEVLEREAIVAMAALADLQGEALLKQLDRVHAAATKLLDRAPESETARGLLRDAERRRELGIRQRERASHRRTMRRTLIVGLALALVGTGSAAWVVNEQKLATDDALAEARTERDAKSAALREAEHQKRETVRALELARTESQARSAAVRDARARGLADASKAAEAVDPMRALLLAREAAHVNEDMSPAVVSQLHSALVVALQDVVFLGDGGPVSLAIYSPRRGSLLTASGDHTARIWKEDGTSLARLVGHDRAIRCAAFAPTDDRVVTGSEDCTARIWDVDGRQIAELRGHTDTVDAVAYSPDGTRIVTASLDGTARLWDADGRPLAVLRGHTKSLNTVVWSPEGDRIATASEDGDVRLWKGDGTAVGNLPHDSSPVRALAFPPTDGHFLLTGTASGVTRLWDLETMRPKQVGAPGSAVTSVAFAHSHFAAGRDDGTASLWNLDGTLVTELLGHTGAVKCMAFSPAGDLLATAGDSDRTARVWDLGGGGVSVLRGHTGPVSGVSFSAGFSSNLGRLLTASGDGTARTWRVKGAEIATYRSVKWGMHAMAVCHCGFEWFLSVPTEGPAQRHNKMGKAVKQYGSGDDRDRSARFSTDVRRVVIGDRHGTVRVFELNGDPITEFQAHDGPCSAEFSPQDGSILTWSDDATAKLWDLAGTLRQTFRGHGGPVTSAAFSPTDGNLIVTGSADGRARIWDIRTGKKLHDLEGHWDAVTTAVFSHDGQHVLTAGGADQTVKVWDLDGNERQRLVLASAATVAAFSPNAPLVAIGCGDGSTWLWNFETGRTIAQLPGHSARVIAVEFDADGVNLTTACWDGNVRVRRTMPQDVLRIVEDRVTRPFSHVELEAYKALLGPEYDAARAAYEYVERKLASAVVVEDVVAQVRADETLPSEVRAKALEVLARTLDDPERVRERTWELAGTPGRSAAVCADVLRWATAANVLLHASSEARLLLGVAQHRAGDEVTALRTLEEADGKYRDSPSWPHIACVAALALVHHSLGDDAKARDEFARLDVLVGTRTEQVPFAYRVFLEEARALRRELGPAK